MKSLCTTLISVMACAVAAILFSGCGTSRRVACEPQTRIIDSTRTIYRLRTVYVPDTAYIQLPRQTAERTSRDSVSRIETEYAESYVRLNPDGTLTHRLRNKEQRVEVPGQRRVEYRDSIVFRDRYKTVTKTVSVERKRRWYETGCIYGFCGAIILLAYSYRKQIRKAVVRLFLTK